MEDLPQKLQPRGSSLELTVLMIVERLQALEDVVHKACETRSEAAKMRYDPCHPLHHLAALASREIKDRYQEWAHQREAFVYHCERVPPEFHRIHLTEPADARMLDVGRHAGATFFRRRFDLLRAQLTFQSYYGTADDMPQDMPNWLYVSWRSTSPPKTDPTSMSTWERVE